MLLLLPSAVNLLATLLGTLYVQHVALHVNTIANMR